MAVQLDLIVAPAKIFQLACRIDARQIAGEVKPPLRFLRSLDERRVFIGSVDIAQSDPNPADYQLAGLHRQTAPVRFI